MPIQIKDIDSLPEVKKSLRAFETQYNMSSEQFTCDLALRSSVPEFDGIDWSFLLMQVKAMEEDDTCVSGVFLSSWKSKISTVDTVTTYEDVAA